MWCTGAPRTLLAIATVDEDYDLTTGTIVERLRSVHYRWIERDELEIARLVELGLWLWEHVERGELPEPTDPEALPCVKAANARPCINCDGRGIVDAEPCVLCGGDGWDRQVIEPTPDLDDLAELIERREQIKAAAKAVEDEAKTIEARIRHRMGEATEATTTDGAWRVRCGLPIRKFTSQSEADFLGQHLPKVLELGLSRTVLDRDKAKELMPEQFDDARIATPDRRLTVKDLREDKHQ
jgi:hypothetical protein